MGPWLARLARLGLYPTTLVLLAAQVGFLASFVALRREPVTLDARGVLVLALSFVPGPALVRLVHLAAHGRRALLVALDSLLVALYAVLYAVHLDTHGSCDYSLVHDNFREIFYTESAGLIFAAPALACLGGAAVVVAALIAAEARARLLSRWERPPRHRWRIAACAALCLALAAWPERLHDEVIAFVHSARAYYLRSDDAAAARVAALGIDPHQPYPYHRPPGGAAAAPRRPHVFVLALESFNANFARSRTPDGQEYTPVFNRLSERGVSVERFYANSIQTERGHFALLCSVVPSMRKKVAVAYPSLRLHCLPDVLRAAGYDTIFFTGQGTLAFDNAGAWMTRQGFNRVHAMDGRFPVDPTRRWGWGAQDDELYRNVFAYLDGLEASGRDAGPRFVFVATVSNHARFDSMPRDQRHLYPRPASGRERYANSVHLADRYLATFFAELERRPHLRDSLVVLTGDHGFPAGEHGNTWNEYGAYEENFRTPFLVLWPGQLRPGVVADRPASQLDVAPTVMDLLGLDGPTHFLGRSVLAAGAARAIPLVQPYDGTHLGAVKGPLKLVRHLRTRREALYDLERDPRETTNLIDAFRGRRELEELRATIALIQFNQSLLETDRIWPPG